MNSCDIEEQFGGECCDEISITGFEAIRSDVANLTQRTQRWVLETILRNDDDEAKQLCYEYVRDEHKRLKEGNVELEDVGVRGGIQKPLTSYGSSSRRPQPIYRASKYSKDNIDGEGGLGKASKPMYWPVTEVTDSDLPKRYDSDTAEDGERVDYIAAENPQNIADVVDIDYDQLTEKLLRDRIQPIFRVMGWDYDDALVGHEDTALANFM